MEPERKNEYTIYEAADGTRHLNPYRIYDLEAMQRELAEQAAINAAIREAAGKQVDEKEKAGE